LAHEGKHGLHHEQRRHDVEIQDGAETLGVDLGTTDLVRRLDAEKIQQVCAIDFLRRSERRRAWIAPVERRG
jgi:hypothetical protein